MRSNKVNKGESNTNVTVTVTESVTLTLTINVSCHDVYEINGRFFVSDLLCRCSLVDIDARALNFLQNVDSMYAQQGNEFGDLDLHRL